MDKKTKIKYENLIGKKFNSLTVQDFIYVPKHNRYMLKCKCDCGTVKYIRSNRVINGYTKTCGCQNIGIRANDMFGITRKEPHLYSVWNTMRHRCTNPKNWKYESYGKRGISVCDEWLKDFFSFREWAWANGYRQGLSLDRIDNNGNYEPSNCRWADNYVQQRNKRNNRYIEYKGKRQTVADWADELKIPYPALSARINKLGWSIEKAIETPVKHPNRRSI